MTAVSPLKQLLLIVTLLCLAFFQLARAAEQTPATKNAKPAITSDATTQSANSEIVSTHPEPKRGGLCWSRPPDAVTPTSDKRNNIFYVGEPVVFGLASNVISYEVRDYWGNMVDKGTGGASITVKVKTPGWYKLYCYGKESREAWGDSVGATTFVIFRNDPNFPALPPRDTSGGSHPAMDEIVRGVTGMGPQRHAVFPDRYRKAIRGLQRDVDLDKKYYIPFDPLRKRALMVAFPGGTANLEGVRAIVEHFKKDIRYWEPRNEPNDSPPGAFATVEMKQFYDTVKSVVPSLRVMGPGVVELRPWTLEWMDQFFKAGGGDITDCFSFHIYNGINGDLQLARKSLDAVNSLLAKYGMEHVEKWQTEQGFGAVCNGLYLPRLQGRWTMLEMMVFEQYGIPKEHNHLWYDRSHGFWDVATWWENEDGSLNPAAPLMRVFSEELFGTTFTHAYDFGPAGNNIYLGNLYIGPGKTIAAFMSAGSTDGKVDLAVRGGDKLHVVSAFGVEQDLQVSNGRVVLSVAELPVYVELADNQEMDVIPLLWGENLARGPDVVVTASAGEVNPLRPKCPNAPSKMADGVFESWYWSQNWDQDNPWMADMKNGPVWVQFLFPEKQSVSHVVVYASPSWQCWGTLLDYELQYESAGKWVTLEHVKEPTRTIGVFTDFAHSTVDSFFSDRCVFRHDFKPVTTRKIRLMINDSAWGGGPNKMAVEAGGQCGDHFICVREIEIYGDKPAVAAVVTVQPNQIKTPQSVQVQVHAVQNQGDVFNSIAVVRPPNGWTVSPANAKLDLTGKGDSRTLYFTLTPSGNAEPGIVPVTVDFMDKGRPIRSEKTSFDLIPPVGLALALKTTESGPAIAATLRNVSEKPITADVTMSVDGIKVGPAKSVTLEALSAPQWVLIPLQGIKPTGARQTVSCVLSSNGKTLASKTFDCVILPCRYIGPFPMAGIGSSHAIESGIKFANSYDSVDGKTAWTRGLGDANGYFDFVAKFRTIQNATAYAVTFIHSDKNVGVNLNFGSDDGIKAWLNGTSLLEKDVQRAAAPGQEVVKATLKTGWNTVLMKITEAVPPWGFYFAVTDDAGMPVKGIYLSDSTPAMGEGLTPAAAPAAAEKPQAAAKKKAPGPFKMKITFSGYDKDESLTDFPLMVKFENNMGGTDFSYTKYPFLTDQGYDLRFWNADQSVELPYEIEAWNTNGVSTVWVLVPTLAANTDYIWATWADPAKTNREAYTKDGRVWPTDKFIGVWHLNQRNPDDSTANDNGGDAGGIVNPVGGIAGGALDFPSNGYIRIDGDPALNCGTAAATISGWIRFNALPSAEQAITRVDGKWQLGFINGPRLRLRNLLGTQGKSGWTASNDVDLPAPPVTGQWYYMAMTYDGAAGKLITFWNSVPLGTGFEVTGDICAVQHGGAINYNNCNAAIDEVRVEKVARSANWLWACYMNLASSATFCKYEIVPGK